MADTTEYILRKPLNLANPITKGSYKVHLDRDTYFVPLDRQALRKQVEDVLTELAKESGYNDEGFKGEPNVKWETNEILALFGLENTEET